MTQDKRYKLLQFARSKIIEIHNEARKKEPHKQFVIVVCDLLDSFGRAIAEWDNSPKGDSNLWSFAVTLQEWIDVRKRHIGSDLDFKDERDCIRFAVISGNTPLIGIMLRMPDDAGDNYITDGQHRFKIYLN